METVMQCQELGFLDRVLSQNYNIKPLEGFACNTCTALDSRLRFMRN